MSEEQRRDTDTRSDVGLKQKIWNNERIKNKMDKLSFLVRTRDVDDPSNSPQDRIRTSYLNLARKTVRRRTKKDFDADWNAKPAGTTIQNVSSSTTTRKIPGKKVVVVRNSYLAPKIERVPYGNLQLERGTS